MSSKKTPDFSFGRPPSREDRDPTIRELRLLEDAAVKSAEPGGAYNPYDRGVGEAQSSIQHRSGTTTRTDLRKLSEWIRLKKEIDELKAAEGDTVSLKVAPPDSKS